MSAYVKVYMDMHVCMHSIVIYMHNIVYIPSLNIVQLFNFCLSKVEQKIDRKNCISDSGINEVLGKNFSSNHAPVMLWLCVHVHVMVCTVLPT